MVGRAVRKKKDVLLKTNTQNAAFDDQLELWNWSYVFWSEKIQIQIFVFNHMTKLSTIRQQNTVSIYEYDLKKYYPKSCQV